MKQTARIVGSTGLLLMVTAASMFAQATTPAAPATPAPSGAADTTAPSPEPGKAVTTGTTTSSSQQMAPIYVTGSYIPTTETEGATPVVSIDSATIQRRGYVTAQDVIKNLPSNNSGSSTGTVSNAFAAGAAYASLRGLGPQATLVLINGRRAVNYAAAGNGQYGFVDLNSIPADIIDRVEVLTSGTALYGADAVAGVINIITKKTLGDDDAVIDAYIGNTDNTDSLIQRYSVSGNLSSFDKNGYGIVEADWTKQNSMYARDRQISTNADERSKGGLDNRSFTPYPGEFQGEGDGNFFTINPGVTGSHVLTGTTPGTDASVNNGIDLNNFPAGYARYDFNPDTSIIPETERYGVYMNYTYKFYDGNVNPNIDFSYRHNHTELSSAPAPGGGFTVPTDNPFNGSNQIIDVDILRFVELGPRIEDVDNDLFRAVPSVDIKLGNGWTLNAGFNFNYSFLDDVSKNFPSFNNVQNALNQTDPTKAYNPFNSAGGNSPAVLNSLLAYSENRASTSLLGEDFRFNGSLFNLPAGPVQMAFGGEYRIERYNQSYSPEDLSGDVIGSSVQQDIAASRKALSGYAQVDFPLTSPSFNMPGFYSMDILVAGRVDKYSNFGSTENPQVAIRWETIPGLVIRGSYTKAFRAPSLPELFAGGNQAFVTVIDNQTGSNPEVLENSGGNPDLKPETAEIFSGGIAYSPTFAKGLLLTADFYKIRYSGQILPDDPQVLVDSGSSKVHRDGTGQITSIDVNYSNVADSVNQGIDWGIQYTVGDANVDWGQLTFALNGTFVLDYIFSGGELVGEDAGVGGYPRYRQDTSLTYDFRGFEYVLSSDYSSGYSDSSVETATDDGDGNAINPIIRTVGANVTFNMQASYTFDKEIEKISPGPRGGFWDWRNLVAGTRVAIGCNNVWDFQPPFSANPQNTLGYDQTYADPTGRFIYGQITRKF